MNIAESAKTQENILQQIKPLRLMDDVLMVKCFENNKECTELLLQPILKMSTLQVKEVTSVWHEASVGLNVFATDRQGWTFQIKVFQDSTADRDKKVGMDLYSAELSAAHTDTDTDRNIAGHYTVYIVEHGVERKALAHSGIILDGGTTDAWWGFKLNTIYVNGDRKNRSPLGKLMYDFSCTGPSYMNYPQLADRVRYFKEDRQGVQDLCEILEDKRKRVQKYEASQYDPEMEEGRN